MYKPPKPAQFLLFPRKFKTTIVESFGLFDIVMTPVDASPTIVTVNNEVFPASTLTFQSIVTLSSAPAIMSMHVVSDLNPNPQYGEVYSGNQWINIGNGIGGTF